MKRLPYLLASLMPLPLFASYSKRREAFQISEGYVGMFGYGSLISKNFIETGLLGGNYEGPFLPVHLKGYQRSWTFAWPSDIPAATADGQYYKAAILSEGWVSERIDSEVCEGLTNEANESLSEAMKFRL